DVVLSAQSGIPYLLDGVNVWPTVNKKRDIFTFLQDADLIVAHLDNTTRATVLGEFNSKPVAVVHHNTFDESKEAIVLPSSRTDLVVANSIHMFAELNEFYVRQELASPPPTIIVRPTADPRDFEGTPGDKITLINLRKRDKVSGRDGLSKGGEVFRALAERLPTHQFLGVTGVYGTQIDLSDLPNVEVIDHVPHHEMVEKVYGRTRILLVPSSYESWGRVASEAMCLGIPVIASPTPGLIEQLGYAGSLADPENVEAWEQRVKKLDNVDRWHDASHMSLARARDLAEMGREDMAVWCATAEQVVKREQSLAC
ncbi:MAG: glycosyltransferase family 4 protein, partial [Actinomycetia bacterium]|nr:glycosyltransferase family 4 protein [Actinomycetes bacterium]